MKTRGPLPLRVSATGVTTSGQSAVYTAKTRVPIDGFLREYELSLPADDGIEAILYCNGQQIAPLDGTLRSPRAREANGTLSRSVQEGDFLVLWVRTTSLTDQVVVGTVTVEGLEMDTPYIGPFDPAIPVVVDED